MRISTLKIRMVLLSGVAVPLLFLSILRLNSKGAQVPGITEKPIVVRLERVEGRWTYKLDPNQAPGQTVLDGLIKLVEQRGPDYPVIGLVDDKSRRVCSQPT